MTNYHEHVILLGARSILSFAGIAAICVGQWMADRYHDELEHSVVSATNGEDAYRNMEASSNQHANQNETVSDSDTPVKDANNSSVKGFRTWKEYFSFRHIHHTLLETYFSFVSMMGWVLLLLSTMYSTNDWFDLVDGRHFSWPLVALLLSMGYGHVFILPTLQSPFFPPHHAILPLILILAYSLLAVLLATRSNTNASVPRCVMACLAIPVAHILLSAERKRYNPTEQQQRMVPPSVFGFGPPLLIAGWIALWTFWNSTQGAPDYAYIPIYTGTKAAIVANLGASALQILFCMAGYAQDLCQKRLGFWGYVWSYKAAWPVQLTCILAWTTLGAAAFVAQTRVWERWLLFLVHIPQGVAWAHCYRQVSQVVAAAAVVHSSNGLTHLPIVDATPASPPSSPSSTSTPFGASFQVMVNCQITKALIWTNRCRILAFMWWAVLSIVKRSWLATIIGGVSVTAILTGLRGLHRDRQRGETVWRALQTLASSSMSSSTTKKHGPQESDLPLVVYSIGAVLVPAGLAGMAYAVAMPA